MKVSIITVCYNAVHSIERTILSVRNQNYPDIEHIVIDGGSTDGTLHILEKYKEHFSYMVSEPDKGIYDAMNKGLARATGDIVALLNADDAYADNTVISKIVATMKKDSLDACFGDAVFFRAQTPEHIIRHYHSSRFKPSRIPYGWMPAHPTLFLRKKVYDRFGVFRPEYKIAGDFEFVARIFRDNSLKYRHIPEVLVRMQAGGVSTCGWRSTLRINREVVKACRDNGMRTNMLCILSKYPEKLLDFVFK